MERPVLVGYDGTEGADSALDCAIGFAKDLGSGLVVVFGYAPAHTEREVADHREAVHEIGEAATAKAEERAKAAGVEVHSHVVAERSAEALVSASEEHDARMIVVGSYGERPIKAAILGSTPHRLLYLSERPVLVVRS